MNVLLTSVGRRSYLVHYFRQALAGRGCVFAANSRGDVPGMQVADEAFVVPPSHDPDYIGTIIRLCREHRVGLLCSCHDLDTLVLARERARFEEAGVAAMLPTAEWARLCLDKFEGGQRLREAGFTVPWSTLSLAEATSAVARGEAAFPMLIKARFGFGSLGQAVCRDMDELEWLYRRAVADQRESDIGRFIDTPPEQRVLVQAHVAGPEWCLVLVNDPNGRHAAHFVTEVHRMRAGESDRATTLPPDVLGDFPERLAALIGHSGIWGIDLRMGDGRPAIIDLNPRFAGDYPFQHIAGADVPAALIAWALGEEPDPAWLRSEAGVTGYKDLVPRREGCAE